MMLRPGVTYSVEVSGNANIVSYRIELTQPVGYEVLLSNVSGSDLIARNIYPADNTLNDPDTFQFLVRPTGFSGAVRKVGEATSWSTDRLIWEVGMGQLKNGNAAGAISIQADDFSEITYTPSDLNYSSPSTEVSVVLDSSTGALRQVNAPQALADIVDGTPNDDKYEIRFYSWKDVTGWNGTIYTVMGTPFVTYEISKPANEEISIKKTFTTGTDYYTTHLRYLSAQMTWEMYDWTLNLDAVGNSMRKVITVVTSTGETIGSTKTTVIEEYGRKLENND
ncbi:MAG: hypothetical protein D6781_11850 [Verrucomicrobia bacterium]|nr:MAG: hypothetical protein D6781_11850 [Verrucomicrobiota bacterium]